MSETKNKNMELWDQVCVTDPGITRPVELGRRKFTAVDAQHQIKRATELWGPYGDKWGVMACKYDYVRDAKGEPVEATLEACFMYPTATFAISTDIAYKPGNDTRKKLLTDLTTKALSKLGFNSDVFEGLYDDNKYVQGLKEQKKTQTDSKAPVDASIKHALDSIKKDLNDEERFTAILGLYKCNSIAEIPNKAVAREIWTHINEEIKASKAQAQPKEEEQCQS